MNPASAADASVDNRIARASQTARRLVWTACLASALLIGLLMAERWAFQRDRAEHGADLRQVQQIADAARLQDERLTGTARLAASTGDRHWLDTYARHAPRVDVTPAAAAIQTAAPGLQGLLDEVRTASERLAALERSSLEQVARDDLAAARAILDRPDYADSKAALADSTARFSAAVQQQAEQDLSALTHRSWLLAGVALALFAAGTTWLNRRLSRHLKQAETAFAAKQTEVTHLALHDTLTGLANRRYLLLQIGSAIQRAHRDHQRFALLMMDLDGFKPINDRFGHQAGDAVLAAVARRMLGLVRPGDVVARLGGDEFVVMLDHGTDAEVPLRMAQRLIGAVAQSILLPQGEVAVSASVGVALFPEDATDADNLLRRADVALYRAKAESRGEARFFQASMDEDVRERDALKLDLRIAIERGDIKPYFQPLINLATGALNGFEVLARWHHPTRGHIPPNQFVKVAEDSGQIDAMTVCVMREALRAALDWDPRLTVAINIAPQQLKNDSLVERLMTVLRDTGFPAERFEIEITENALIGDLELARRIVMALKGHGIRVALDDFGTGYSSLSHLSELPFDKIKIDRSFIHNLRQRHENATIVNAIIGLGRSLNLPTAAEGIESIADADMLAELGCNVGQGFLYSRPVPASEVQRLIESMQGHDSAIAELA
jgi:diguanylate cyclase (GGDEF)-like protein